MVANIFLLHINRLESRLTEETKKQAVIVLLVDELSILQTAAFLKLAKSFVFKVRSELKTVLCLMFIQKTILSAI